MTAVADVASVRIFIADYVASGSDGKTTIVGGGVSVLGRQAIVSGDAPVNTEALPTSGFGVFASVSVGPEMVGRRIKMELSLRRADDSVVEIPVAASGEPSGARHEPVIISHAQKLERPTFAHPFKVPPNIMQSKAQLLLQFPTGLPLTPGRYYWQVTIDGVSRQDWTEEFYAAP